MHPSIRLVERPRLRPRMELTALVDCVFLLLVLFLLTSTYSRQRQLDLSLQPLQSGIAVDESPSPAEVAVTASGELLVDGEVLDDPGLAAFLAALVAAQPDQALSVIADQQAPAGRVLFVLDEARLAGLRDINLTGREPVASEGAR